MNRISELSPNIYDLVSTGEISLIINTPTKGSQQNRDGFKIRRCAVERSIPCLTSLDTAKALLLSLKYDVPYDENIVDITEI